VSVVGVSQFMVGKSPETASAESDFLRWVWARSMVNADDDSGHDPAGRVLTSICDCCYGAKPRIQG
jgi:hypothetical protein